MNRGLQNTKHGRYVLYSGLMTYKTEGRRIPRTFEIISVKFNVCCTFNPGKLNMPRASSLILMLFMMSSFEAVIIDLNKGVVF